MTTDPRSVLVIDNNRKQLAGIARIVRTLVRDTETSERIGDAAALAGRQLIVVNYDSLDVTDRGTLLSAARRDAAPRVVLLSGQSDNEGLIEALGEYGLCNVVAINGAPRSTELAVTLRKIVSGDIFGLTKYFGWGIEAHPAKISASADAAHFVSHVTRYARALDVHPRLVDQVATVAEELVSNALYNAPVDETGARRFAHLPRTTDVELTEDEHITASVACDGRWFGLSVVDPFGSLSKQDCLDHLVRGLRDKDRELDAEKGGAGLGLYMTFDSLNQLAINIAPGRQTEVIGMLDVSGSYRDFANRGKSFNVFVEQSDD